MYNENSSAVASRAVIDDTARVSDRIEIVARSYHAELLRVLRRRLASEQDAADLAQEAYARLLRYEGEHTAEDLRRILFGIARNLLTDHWRWRRLRSVGTHLPLDDLDFEIESGEANPERQVESAQRLASLEAIILAMPEKRRAVFILSRIEGLTNAEIAERCGIAVKTVEKHIASALAECRAGVGENGPQSL